MRSDKMRVSVVLGTRPEAIKLWPVIKSFQVRESVDCEVCSTGQHERILDELFLELGIAPAAHCGVMVPNQSLASLTARSITAIDSYLADRKPQLLVVEGDTTTVFAASLAAFYLKIPVAHVEAGLRTGYIDSPWPEEAYRLLVARIADLHFAPTARARQNLLDEGISNEQILVTGNTSVDALFLALGLLRERKHLFTEERAIARWMQTDSTIVLVTAHRRENWGTKLESICHAILDLARYFPHIDFVFPVHPNPEVNSRVVRILGNSGNQGHHIRNVHLVAPLSYLSLVALMDRATLILTDSGGIQEEAPSLGKPVLVLRDHTERPEGLEAGAALLVGANRERIVAEVRRILNDTDAYAAMARARNLFGDGKASARIVERCCEYLANKAHEPHLLPSHR